MKLKRWVANTLRTINIALVIFAIGVDAESLLLFALLKIIPMAIVLINFIILYKYTNIYKY